MYKVLIVEDEKLIRKGIIYTFDWTAHDCTVVGEACNGAEGMEKIYQLMPDIVITDITMPIMDGLTMIEKSIDECIYTAIIISAFDEFHLAKKAIKMGVAEYLVKPLDHTQLTDAISQAKVQLKQKRLYSQVDSRSGEKLEIDVLPGLNTNVTSKKAQYMLDYIKENYMERISINDIKEELEASGTYLRQVFKAQTSYTFNEFLNRYRVQQAMEKIKNENGKIYNIAAEVGFSDYHYFINVFKKYTNYSPSKFKEYFVQE